MVKKETTPKLTARMLQLARGIDMVNYEYKYSFGTKWRTIEGMRTEDLMKQLTRHNDTLYLRKKTLGKTLFYSIDNIHGKLKATDRSYAEDY